MSTDHGTGPDRQQLPPPTPLPELESELLGLAGHIAAAECRFLQLLAEFDRRDGWAGVGVRSCAHWLTWRAGMSMRTATEHLRIARALENLPRIRAEFAAGRISYSKVRAITRVTGSDTAALARMADRITGPSATGSGTARPSGISRASDRTGPSTVGDTAPSAADRTAAPDPGHTDGFGRDGTFRTNSTNSTDRTDRTAGTAGTDEDTAGAGIVDSDAAPDYDDPDSDAPDSDAPDRDDQRCDEQGCDDQDCPDQDDDRGCTDRDCDDQDCATDGTTTGVSVADPEVAEQILLELALSGTASHVETVVRAVRRRTAPPTVTATRRGLSWYHDADGSLVLRGRFTPEDGAELVAAISSRLTVPAPAGHDPEQAPGPVADPSAAQRADALLDLVRHQEGRAGDDAPAVTRGEARVVVHIDAGTGTARLANGPEIPGPTAERLACDARGRVLLDDRRRNRLYLGRSRRLASPAQIAALTARDCADGGGCRFPGCDSTRYLHAHHVRHWLRGGRTDIDNLVLLCGFHHRLVHDHGYLIHYADGRWQFRRADGTPVPGAGAPLSGDDGALVARNTGAGLGIDGDSLTPEWYGDRLDPGLILDALLPPVVPGTAA